MSWREPFLRGIREGRPVTGPASVHIDITNSCNAACVTCWDHSPHLKTPRSAEWKRRRLPLARFEAILSELLSMGSLRHIVISGMGDPLTHPDALSMITHARRAGLSVTLISNLLAAEPDALIEAAPEQILAGVQGVSPESYTAFHPGWTEAHFFRLCATLRALGRAPIRVRHVHVIETHNAGELSEMVRFGKTLRAERVTFKLASLAAGTEAVAITPEQRDALLSREIASARALAERLSVHTNLDLFEKSLRASLTDLGDRATAPLHDIDCHMGHVFARITVDEEALYCCNVEIPIGSLREHTFTDLWYGARWQALRQQIAAREWFSGCERCGKTEQNTKWTQLVR